jgi:hypothetical protein
MAGYVTYMEVYLNSEGVSPKQLSETLRGIGWKPCYGRYDFAYEWGSDWGNKDSNIQEFLEYLNTLHETLRNCKVNYCLRTYEHGTEDFPVRRCE